MITTFGVIYYKLNVTWSAALNVGLLLSKKIDDIYFNQCPLKIIKKCFLFHVESSFSFLRLSHFCLDFLFSRNCYFQNLWRSRLQSVTKIVTLAPHAPYSMFVANVLGYLWPPLPGIAFLDLAQHSARGRGNSGYFWASLTFI